MKYKLGAHLYVSRGLYSHHGIYIGNNQVIHYSEPEGGKDGVGFREIFGRTSKENTIHAVQIEEFANGRQIKIKEHDNSLTPETIVANAKSKLGENGYNLYGNNCEHFATWCHSGKASSEQVKTALTLATGIAISLGGLVYNKIKKR